MEQGGEGQQDNQEEERRGLILLSSDKEKIRYVHGQKIEPKIKINCC